MAGKNIFIRNEKKYFVLLIVLLSGLLIAGGYLYYNESSNNIRKNKENELTTIAEMKISQISHWYLDEINDAEVISEDPILTGLIETSIQNPNKIASESLIHLLISLKRQHDYEDIIVTDINSNIITSTNSIYNFNKLSSKLQKFILETIDDGITFSTDLYLCEIEDKISIDFLSPVKNKNDEIIAVIIFQFDPEEFLFPLIQNWPTKSRTSETLLARIEVDEVVFLNELRHIKDTALKLRFSLRKIIIPAVAAALGEKGIYEGYDYRSVRVISYISDIPGTNWFMVSKVDREEILSELKYHWIYVSLFVLLLIFLISSLFTWIYYFRQRDVYKKLWQNQEEYKTTLQSIGDAVITTNLKGKVKYLNPVAEELTGWNFSDAKNKNLKDVFNIINEIKRVEVENPVDKVLREGTIVGLANHTLLISKNGNEIPIADSGAPIKDKNGETIGVVLVFSDQSEERKTQKEIYRLNRVYALLSNTNQSIVRIKEEQKLFDEICRIAITDGKFLVAWIGMLVENSNEFTVAASAHLKNNEFNEDENKVLEIKPCKCLSDKVLNENIYQVVNDLQNSVHIKICVNSELLTACNSAASFPIKKFNKVVGTLNLFSDEIGFFNDEEIKLLDEMAYDISFALEYFETERERNSSIEKFKQSERLLRIASETAKLGGWRVDLEKDVVLWSDEVAEIHECPVGFSPSVKEGINFYAPKWRERITRVFSDCATKGNPYDEEMEIITANGNKVWVRTIGQAVKDDSGKITGVEGAFQDISIKKKNETALRESESNYKFLFLNNPNPMWVYDINTLEFLAVNDTAIKKYGYMREEFLKMSLLDLRPIDEHEKLLENIKEGKVIIQESGPWKHKLKNGTLILVEISSHSLVFSGKQARMVISNDITDRLDAENALRESENKYRLLVENSHDGIEITQDDRIIYSNNQFAHMLGYSIEEIMNVSFKEIYTEQAQKDLYERERKRYSGKELINEYETTFRKKNGEIIHVVVKFEIIEFNNKSATFATIQDITERKKTKESLKQSEEKFRNLFYHHAAIKMIVDPETQNIVDANEAAAKYYGWSVDQLKKMKISQINTISSEEVNNAIDKAKSLQKIHFEFKHRKADGSINDVEIFSSKVVIEGKEYLHSIVHDISEKKKAEEQLELLSRSVEQSPVSVLITDPSGNIEYVNPCFEKVTGYTLDEIKGKNPNILKSGHQTKEVYQKLWETILSGKEWRGELLNKKKNGELYWEDLIISPIVNMEDDILHFVSVKEDITEKKRMIEELIEAKEKAEEMSRLKSSFLANMSHELRTPLIGITGFAYILQEELKEPNLKEMAKGINESGNRLSDTLNLILDLSKFEAEKTYLEIDKLDLVIKTEDLLGSYRESANKKGLNLNSFYSNEIIEFNTDLRAYRSILSNIVNNAIKFTESGEVNIDVSLINEKAVIKISDTGIGIAKEHHELIFEEFRQASEGLSRNFEGTGLGLNITKKIVEIFGGKIFVESEIGKGSTFVVILPQLTAGKKIEKKINTQPLLQEKSEIIPDKPLALLVDDDPIAYEVLKRYTMKNIELDISTNSDSALQMLTEKKYDLIFMDINLRKGLDGKDTTQVIRKMKGYEKIPIIAFTAYAMVGDKEEFLEAGCTHYLSKPFSKKSVIDLLNEIFNIN